MIEAIRFNAVNPGFKGIKTNNTSFMGDTYRSDEVKYTQPAEKGHFSSCLIGQNSEVSRLKILNTIKNSEIYSDTGFTAQVYKLESDGRTYAIKVGRTPEVDFSDEADVLAHVPKGTGQRAVDYFKDPLTGKDILVTTFVSGDKKTLKTKEDFETLFSSLIRLDDAGVLHGDLNIENLLFDGDKLNLIDYGAGSLFETGDKYEELYPDFMVKTNAVNLEHNGIPDYIARWVKNGDDVFGNFKNYLTAKGEFYTLHSLILDVEADDNPSLAEAVDFEKNYAKVLLNPSDLVIENEARRIDALHTFELADTEVNFNRNPKGAVYDWNLTFKKTRDMIKNIDEILEKGGLSEDETKYFKYQRRIAVKMYTTFKDWGGSTIKWIQSSFLKNKEELSLHEMDFRLNAGKAFELPPNSYSPIAEAKNY